jgi:hypothetical protein
MRHRRRNRKELRDGRASRASDCLGHGGGRGDRSELLTAVPGLTTATGPIDGLALAAEIARLADAARRGWNT